ncbi:hypothetical protein ACVWZV_009520 [Bradyrhizobium sp. GM5.1]
MAYNNSGTIGVGDADILISLKPNHAPTDDYIKTMREKLPQQFPGTSFAFLPADIVSQVLNFGVPAPIDLPSRRQRPCGQSQICQRLTDENQGDPGDC